MSVGVGPLLAVEGQHSAERRDRVIALRCRTSPDGVAPLIYTVVNAADYDLIRGAGLKVFAQWSFSNKSKTKKWAYAGVCLEGKPVRLHCFLMKPSPGQCVDHIDRDTLNNRRSNLRLCTQAENSRHRAKGPRSRSKYIGVTRMTSAAGTVSWQARFNTKPKAVQLGTYDTEVEAAQAYDVYVQARGGRQKNLNFPEGTNAVVKMHRWIAVMPLQGVECGGDDFPIVVRVILDPGDSHAETECLPAKEVA